MAALKYVTRHRSDMTGGGGPPAPAAGGLGLPQTADWVLLLGNAQLCLPKMAVIKIPRLHLTVTAGNKSIIRTMSRPEEEWTYLQKRNKTQELANLLRFP